MAVGGHPRISQPGSIANSDDNGMFKLTAPQHTVSVTAYAAGYFPGTTAAITDNVELVLTPETLTRGLVVWDHDSQPVPNAIIFARGSGTSTTSDTNGQFELSLDPNRTNTLIASTQSGHASIEVPPRRTGELIEIDIRLQAAADLELSLTVGEKREPCEDGFIRFEESPLDIRGYLPVSDGLIDVHGLPVGPHSARAGCRSARSSVFRIEMAEGRQHKEIQLERVPALTGRIEAADGSPAAMAAIQFRGEIESSDLASVDGTFVADYLPPGVYEIEARSERRGEGAIAIADTRKGDIEIKLRMQPWSSVRGRVADSRGNAVDGIPLSLVEQPEPRPRGLTTTSADGSFSFPAVRSGDLRIFARGLLVRRADEHILRDHIEFRHDSGSASDFDVVIEDRHRRVDLRIFDSTGEPVPGVQVTLIRMAVTMNGLDYPVGTAFSDLGGDIEFHAVPDGPLAVRYPDGSVEQLDDGGNSFVVHWQP